MYETFIDLDELIVRCRDKVSRNFIQEAVSCYRAGAFRSCIVSTWNAVVFDFLHKLGELELLGDKEAAKLLKEFENLRASGKQFRELWQFESNIPEIALTKFELISTVEKTDIERLFEDRSRCAHPSMTSLEEPFEATAELARYHLRSAITHLLERPPVQGTAARERIFKAVESEYFPVDPEMAIKYFQKSPLARARFVLIKDIVIGLTTDLLIKDRSEAERSRQFSALNAVSIMYHQETRDILNSRLSDIILNRVTDENWDKAIVYLGSITVWDSLSEPCRLKAEAYIDKIDVFEVHQKFFKRISQNVVSILVKASHVSFLRESIVKKLQISLKDLLLLQETSKDEIFREKILIPVLRESSPKATLDELLLMRSEILLKLDKTIEIHTIEKIKASSLIKLVSIASKHQDKWIIDLIESDLEVKIPNANLKDLLAAKSSYLSADEPKIRIIELFNEFIAQQAKEEIENTSLEEIILLMAHYEDKFFIELVEPDLEEKISFANLHDLCRAKSKYKLIDEPKLTVFELFENSISQQIKITPLNDLLDQRVYGNEIPDELIRPILKNNVSEIIDRFIKSSSYRCAGNNAGLVIEIVEYLSPIQWESVLEAFFENDQIHGSNSRYRKFELLFKKSLELSDSVQSYWLSFRKNLNKYDNFNNLKRLIDSHTI